MSSKLFSTIFISSEHCSIFLISSQLFLTHLSSSYVRKLLLSEKALTHNKRCTQKAFAQTSFCTQKLLDTDAFTQKTFYKEKLLHMGCIYTEKLFHTESFYTQQAFTQRPSYAQEGNRMDKILPCTTLSYKTCAISSQLHEITNKKETKTTLHKTRLH